MSKKPSNRRRNREAVLADQVGAVLTHQYSGLFVRPLVPLAIGIHRQIAEAMPMLPKRGINAFLHRWSQRTTYLQSVAKPDSTRHNLDGTIAGPVSDDDRSYASAECERRAAITASRNTRG